MVTYLCWQVERRFCQWQTLQKDECEELIIILADAQRWEIGQGYYYKVVHKWLIQKSENAINDSVESKLYSEHHIRVQADHEQCALVKSSTLWAAHLIRTNQVLVRSCPGHSDDWFYSKERSAKRNDIENLKAKEKGKTFIWGINAKLKVGVCWVCGHDYLLSTTKRKEELWSRNLLAREKVVNLKNLQLHWNGWTHVNSNQSCKKAH